MKYLSILTFLFLFLSVPVSFATQAPEALEVVESSQSSISLDWWDVENIEGYYIYYGTKTGSWSSYEVEGIDLIDESEFLLQWLWADTTYFIAVTALDEFWKESEYSQEISHKTQSIGWWTVDTSNFRIVDVEVVDESTIELKFSTDLEMSPDASRVFIVEDKQMGTEIPVDISQVSDSDNKNVLVLLWVDMVENTEYKVTVLEIRDAKGNTIESGIDAFVSYTTWSNFGETSLNSAPEDVVITEEDEEEDEEEPVQLTATENEDDIPEDGTPQNKDDTKEIVITPLQSTWKTQSAGNGWSSLSQEDIDANKVTKAANSTNKLPQAGPEMWLLFWFIALFIWALLLIIRSKKEA